MTLAGYPGWSSCSGGSTPSPTPWLVNVGRKSIVAFADLTALGAYAPPQSQVDNIVGWRNYAMTQRSGANFGNFNYIGETDCDKQNFYGSYLLYFGDPPFGILGLSDKLLASTYPFTSVASYISNNRTDQSLTTRQQLLRLQRSLGFSQNVLQYMGSFSRERNRPAQDWPGLNPAGSLSEGRFNLNNLALVVPNPADCFIAHGKAWLDRGKLSYRLRRFPLQNDCGTFPRSPVKGIRWSEQDYLRRMGRGREVHRGGIDCYQEPCLTNQCRQGKQICFPGKIDDFGLVLNRRDVRLLVL